MAEQKEKQKIERKIAKGERRKFEKEDLKKPEKKPQQEAEQEFLIRIMGYDIPGSKNLFVGLTRIKGVGWAIANAVCVKLGYPKSKKISELSKADIKKIEDFLHSLPVYDFLKNRRLDEETGETSHYYGVDLDLRRDFDIKKMKKIKSYKGIRHSAGLPVRGQRTRSHFRTHGSKAVGVKKSKLGKKA